MNVFHLLGEVDSTVCVKCKRDYYDKPYKDQIFTRKTHIWTNPEKYADNNYVNCLDPLAKIFEIQES